MRLINVEVFSIPKFLIVCKPSENQFINHNIRIPIQYIFILTEPLNGTPMQLLISNTSKTFGITDYYCNLHCHNSQ